MPWVQTKLQSYNNENSMVLAKNRNINQWNKIGSPELSPHTYDQLIYNMRGKNIQ